MAVNNPDHEPSTLPANVGLDTTYSSDEDSGPVVDTGLPPLEIDRIALQREREQLLARMFGTKVEPPRLGHYVVLEELGRGGMGVVYAALDPTLDRKVAIKLMTGHRGHEFRVRFEREAKAMAKLAHPNVVQVYEIGATEDSTFIAMEFVEGTTLRKWLTAPRSRAEILATFMAAGRGLAAAHEAGLVHRDFKPDNVMVRPDGRVLVMDFGLAGRDPTPLATEPAPGPVEGATDLTNTGAVMGTPVYMAPEQWRDAKVTPKADQFGFCVALWEALHGERPFDDSSRATLERAVTTGALRPPKRASMPQWIQQALERGLAVEPSRRFGSMHALLDALAADPSARLWRWGGAGLVLLVLLSLTMVLVGRGDELRRARESNEQLREIEKSARSISEGNAHHGHLRELTNAIQLADRFGPQPALELGPEFASVPAMVTNALLDASNVEGIWGTRLELLGHVGLVADIEWSPDDQRVATGGEDRTLRVWSAITGDSIHVWELGGSIVDIEFSPDGSRLVAASDDGRVTVWNVGSGQLEQEIVDCSGAMAITRTGMLVTANTNGGAQVRDLDSGQWLADLDGHGDEIQAIATSPDGQQVATAGTDGSARLWAVPSGRLLHELGHHAAVTAVEFSTDGQLLATASADRSARVWWADTAELLHILDESHCEIRTIDFSPRGNQLLTACVGAAEIWDLKSGDRLRQMNRDIVGASYSRDGESVLTQTYTGAELWASDTGAWQDKMELQVEGKLRPNSALYSFDDRSIAIAGGQGNAAIWTRTDGHQQALALEIHTPVEFAAISHDGTSAATATSRTVRTWDVATGTMRLEWTSPEHPVIGLTAAQDSGFLITTSSSGQSIFRSTGSQFFVCGARESEVLEVWSPDSSHRVHDLTGRAHQPILAASRASELLLSSSYGDSSTMILREDGSEAKLGAAGQVGALALSHDDRLALTAGLDIDIWDAVTATKIQRLDQSPHVDHASFSPDGRLAIAASFGGHLWIWDTATGHLLNERERTNPILAVGFSEDGRDLLTISNDGTLEREPVDPLLGTCRKIAKTTQSRRVAVPCARAEVRERSGFVHVPEHESARETRRLDIQLWLVLAAFHGLVPLLVLVTGLAASLRNWAGASTLRQSLVVAAFLSPCTILSTIAHLEGPLHLGVFVRLGALVGFGVLASLALVWLIRKQPERWWLWLGLTIPSLISGLALFNPQALVALLDQGSILPPAMQVSLYPLAKLAGLETSSGFAAHLEAHVELHHFTIALVGVGLACLLGFWLVHQILRFCAGRFGHRFGFERVNLVTLPVLFAAFNGVALLFLPLAVLGFQQLEREADRAGLDASHDNRGCATAAVVEDRERTDLDTTPFIDWEIERIPLVDRIDFCNEYRPWDPNDPPFYAVALEVAASW